MFPKIVLHLNEHSMLYVHEHFPYAISSSAKFGYTFMGSHTAKIMFTYQILMQTSTQTIKDIQSPGEHIGR